MADLRTKPLAYKEFDHLVDMCCDSKTSKFAAGDKEPSVNSPAQRKGVVEGLASGLPRVS